MSAGISNWGQGLQLPCCPSYSQQPGGRWGFKGWDPVNPTAPAPFVLTRLSIFGVQRSGCVLWWREISRCYSTGGIFLTGWCWVCNQNNTTVYLTSFISLLWPLTLPVSFSYDTWIPASEIEAAVEDPPSPEKPRKVLDFLSLFVVACFSSLVSFCWPLIQKVISVLNVLGSEGPRQVDFRPGPV